jgi:hypothetical protein
MKRNLTCHPPLQKANRTRGLPVQSSDNTRGFKLFLTMLLIAILGFGQSAYSRVVNFNFTGTAPSNNTPWTTGTVLNQGVTLTTGFSRGAGATGTTTNNRFSCTNFNVATLALAISGNKYVEFTITPVSGYPLDLRGAVVNYTIQASGTGITSAGLFSSIDGFSAANVLQSTTSGINNATLPITYTFGTDSQYQNITSAITFRIYGWGASAGAGTMSINAMSVGGVFSPIVQNIPYTQNFGTTAFSAFPTGFQGYSGFSGAAISTQALAEATSPVNCAVVNTPVGYTGNAFSAEPSGGIFGFVTSSNGRLSISTSNSATTGLNQPVCAINTGAGVTSLTVAYDLEVLFSGDRPIGNALQYRTGSSGSWTTVSGSTVNYAASPTINSITNRSLTVTGLSANTDYQFRWISWRNATGTTNTSIGLDNVSITALTCTNLSGLSYTNASPTPYCTSTPITANNATVTGTAPSSYSINPDITANTGLAFNTSTGAITGTPTSVSSSTVYTITATNSCPSTTTATVTVAVNAPPTALSYGTPTASYCNGTLISDNTPSFTGSAATSYAISPNITTNTGLTFNTSTGVISGTPTTISAATTYTVTVTNACSNTTTTISVAVLAPPSALGYSTSTANYCQGTAIANNTPSFTGSTATSYAISPSLNGNTGLTFNTTTGIISGTPTTASASTIYTVTVTNACGSTTTTIDVIVNGQSTVATLSGTATITSDNSTNLQVAITGGTSPYTVELTDGTTPFTVTGYNSNDNISVSPTVNPTTYSLVSVTSANGCLGTGNTGTAVITVNPALGTPVINSTLTASAIYGTLIATTYTITATNSPTSYSATGLPTGLNVNTSTGEISGTPTAVPGNYNVIISATNGSGTGSDILVYTIGQKPLTVTDATGDNKEYNQTTAATISNSTLVGVIAADNGNVTISNTGTFASANVANGIVITSTQTLGGSAASKYSLTVPTGLTGNITPKPLTVTGASVTPKSYDGNTTATVTGGTLNGVIAPDAVTIVNAGTGNYASAGAANGITVTTTAFSLIGAESGNYSVTQPSLTGNITTVALTVSGITANPKTYDGLLPAVLNTGSAAYVGLVNAESFSVTGTITGTFANKNVGTNKVVTISGVAVPSTNYTVTQPTTTTDITKAPLTITGAAVTTKLFDGNTNATITGTLNGIIAPDVVTLVGTGTFATSAVGTGIPVTANCTTSVGAGDNYEINPQPSGLTGTITAVPTFSEVIFPQYIQGLNGTNNNRIPFAYRATVSNLTPNATYRFYNSVELTSALPTAQGAGNNIFTGATQGANFTYSTSPSLTTAGGYGTFTTDANGAYTGWFIIAPSGNATRFVPGTILNTRIVLNDGNNGTAVATILKSNQTITVINTVASAGANNGTGLWGTSSATDKNFIFVYDTVSGSNRPLSGTFVENDGAAQVASFATFYTANVNGTSGRYGMIIPNTNTKGVRRIEQRDFATGAIVGCPAIDSNGVWPSGANTVSPTGGTTAIAITSTDAPLNPSCTTTSSSTTVSICASAAPYSWNSQSLTTSGTYTFTTVNSCGCDSVATLNLTVNALPTVTASASQTTLCSGDNLTLTGGGATSYAWSDGINTLTDAIPFAVTAGTSTYTVTGTDGNSCTATSTVGITVTNCSVTLNLTAFIEGYYDVALAEMRTPLFTTGTTINANDCENLTVELHDQASTVGTPIVAHTFTGVLQKDGTLTCTFPGTVVNNSYYIVISSPNTIKTWSANPYLFDPLALPYAYNFSTAATQAFGGNMIEVSTGRWAVFSGDIDQLNGADLNDFTSWQTDYDNFSSGYYPTDLDGDGSVGLSDFTIWQANFDAFASEVGP